MYHVYVLQSISTNRLYIGMSDDISRRLSEHNSGKTKSTRSYTPYKVIYSEVYENKTEALHRERQIKNSGKIRKELKAGTYTASSRRSRAGV